MKKLLFLVICALSMIALYSCNNEKHTITAEIKGLGNDTVYIVSYTMSNVLSAEGDSEIEDRMDTVIAQDGRFYYDLDVTENTYVNIYPLKIQLLNPYPETGIPAEMPAIYNLYQLYSAHQISLILEPDKPLRIIGKIEKIGTYDYLSYRVKPKSYSADLAEDRDNYKTINLKIDSLNTEIDLLYNGKGKLDTAKERELFDARGKQLQIRRDIWLSYIKRHPDKDLSAYYFTRQTYDTIGAYLDVLTESAKNGIFKEDVKQELQIYEEYKFYQQAKEKIVEGAPAPDFTLLNLDGDPVSLSSLKGKYIVLDFWGSWCGWCIKGFPDMKKYYNKYKNSVEFVGIACDDKDKSWRKAVETHGLDWIQLKDDESGDATKKVSARYAVDGFPTKIILDKDLKIVAIFSGESKEFYEKLDGLL